MSVVASAARGYASKVLDRELEDTITLTVMWENVQDGSTGGEPSTVTKRGVAMFTVAVGAAVGVYTSSWIAATQDVHSQQVRKSIEQRQNAEHMSNLELLPLNLQNFHFMGQKGEVKVDQVRETLTVATGH